MICQYNLVSISSLIFICENISQQKKFFDRFHTCRKEDNIFFTDGKKKETSKGYSGKSFFPTSHTHRRENNFHQTWEMDHQEKILPLPLRVSVAQYRTADKQNHLN